MLQRPHTRHELVPFNYVICQRQSSVPRPRVPHPLPRSLLPQGSSQRGAQGTPPPAKQGAFFGNSPGEPC